MDERGLVRAPHGRTIEHDFAPIFRTEVTERASGGVRIEITKTEERLVAYVDDPAKLDAIHAQLARLAWHGASALAGDPAPAKPPNASPNTLPALIAPDRGQRALLVFGAVVMLVLALAVAFLAGSLQHGPLQANQFFVSSNAPGETRSIDARSARDGSDGTAPRAPVGAEPAPRPAVAADPDGDRSRTPPLRDPLPTIPPPPMPAPAESPAAPPSLYVDRSAPLAAAAPPPLSRAAALDAAYASGAVQSWSEGGDTGFVIADPLRQEGGSTCRTMVLWKRGASQGDVQRSVKCAGPASN